MSGGVIAERMHAQLLAGEPAADVVQAAGHILAVQGQDPRGFRLALRARAVAGSKAADVDAALDGRRLVVTWLNRGTLHLVRAEDYGWLHELTAPPLGRVLRGRLDRVGVSPAEAERAAALILDEVTDGPRTRGELRSALDAAGVPTAGQALVYLIGWAAVTRQVVRGPMRGAEQCFVPAGSWLPTAPSLDRPQALAELARRYLAAHGPATVEDLAAWTRLTLGACRSGFAGLGEEVRKRGEGLTELADPGVRSEAALPPPKLLGPFDPLLHGWASRAWVAGAHKDLVTTNGIFRPFALVEGRAVATWGLAAGRVTLKPLEPIGEEVLAALDRDSQDVLRYLDLPPAPMRVER